MDFTGLESRVCQDCVFSRDSRGEPVFLTFPTSRGCLNSLACGPLLHLQNEPYLYFWFIFLTFPLIRFSLIITFGPIRKIQDTPFFLVPLFLIKLIGVRLVNKVIRFSSIYFYDIWSVYCIVCPPPKVKLSFITIYLTPFAQCYHPTPFLLLTTMLLSVSRSFSFISHI